MLEPIIFSEEEKNYCDADV